MTSGIYKRKKKLTLQQELNKKPKNKIIQELEYPKYNIYAPSLNKGTTLSINNKRIKGVVKLDEY